MREKKTESIKYTPSELQTFQVTHKNERWGLAQWVKSVILATWEMEIRNIEV
jgi:hypothetical protein